MDKPRNKAVDRQAGGLPVTVVFGKVRGKPAARQPSPDLAKTSLFDDARETARNLKRVHRALYNSNPKAFRTVVWKAYSAVFRLKPGPKPDFSIAKAARRRVAGAKWVDLYADHIKYFSSMPESVKDLAETGFRRKVTNYLRHHPQLRSRFATKTRPTKSLRPS